ncbi:MAG: hypothetical protein OXC60_19130 [Litoreibacter sp.]|nr:hypothetical protein [Litoreibacter sp.]
MADLIANNAMPMFIAASFIGGVAVFYLVVIRTMRRRGTAGSRKD